VTNNLSPVDPRALTAGSVLLLTAHPILGPALEAALTALDWKVNLQCSWTPQAEHERSEQHLLLVSDGDGSLPASPALGRPASTTSIAVGSRTELATLARALGEGVRAVVDADRPFTDLVHRLHRLLLDTVSGYPTTDTVRQLELRAVTAARLRSLTRRQRQVLAALVRGYTAAQIASREHLSMPTVRSHIRSILAELDTSSQLTAVALTHWASDDPAMIRAFDELHHF
jgi:DNA-binding NarL/FixJ family response regulator